jgi:hypothetical protein
MISKSLNESKIKSRSVESLPFLGWREDFAELTNIEAYFLEAEELERAVAVRDRSARVQHHATVANRPRVHGCAYSREHLPSGCILYRMAGSEEPDHS